MHCIMSELLDSAGRMAGRLSVERNGSACANSRMLLLLLLSLSLLRHGAGEMRLMQAMVMSGLLA